jgi:hypothetical protein
MNTYIDDTDKDVNEIALFTGFQIVSDVLPDGCLGILLKDFEVIDG